MIKIGKKFTETFFQILVNVRKLMTCLLLRRLYPKKTKPVKGIINRPDIDISLILTNHPEAKCDYILRAKIDLVDRTGNTGIVGPNQHFAKFGDFLVVTTPRHLLFD